MNFFRKNRNTLLKYGFLAFLMIFTIQLVFKNLDISSINNIKDMINKKYIVMGICVIIVYILL